MSMALILSHPVSSFISLATRSLNSLSMTNFLSLCWPRNCCTCSTIFWLFATYRSHTPSHPTMIKLSCGLRSVSVISGSEVTACSSQGRLEKCLYSKSPKERESERVPLTRPCCTYPPAFSILFFSEGESGLWSVERATAVPALLRTALESPMLATKQRSLVMSTTTAVVPALQLIFCPLADVTPSRLLMTVSSSSPRLLSNMSSILLKTLARAFGQFLSLKYGQLSSSLGSVWATQ